LAWPFGGAAISAPAARAATIAAIVVGSAAIVLWLLTGVRVDEIVRYIGYELGFVVLPGWLVYRALVVRAPDRLTELVFGWSLGYFLEIIAFYVTALSGGRSAFYVYPVVVGVPAWLILRRRRRATEPATKEASTTTPLTAGAILILGALLVLLLVYTGTIGFTQTPLPRATGTVTYQEDTVFAISLAADALHHWPMTLPPVLGTPLHYHLFTFMHMAAISEVTGIDLSVVVMRLYQVPMLLLLSLQLVLAGKAVGRRWSTGLVALALVLFVGELDIFPGSDWGRFPFRGFFFYWLMASHSFLVGLVFFVPTTVLMCDLLARGTPVRARKASWILFACFLVACVGSKSYSLLVIGGALVLFALWDVWRCRRIRSATSLALALTGTVYVAANVLVFAWNAAGAQVDPLRNVETMPGVEDLDGYFGHLWGTTAVPRLLGVPYGLFGLLGIPLVGIALLIKYRRLALSDAQVLFLALFVAVLPTLLISSQPGFGQMFLVLFGVAAGAIVSAVGYQLFFLHDGRLDARSALGLAAGGVAAVVLVDVLMNVDARTGLVLTLFWVFISAVTGAVAGAFSRRRALPVGIAVGIAGLVLLDTPLLRVLRGAFGASTRYSIGAGAVAAAAIVGLATVLVVGVVLLGGRAPIRGLIAASVTAALLFGVVDTPLDWFPTLITDAAAGKPAYRQDYAGLTSGLYRGLTWIRDNTSPDAVLVVNNHSLYPDVRDSKYFYYSAFAQRRVVLESWDYSERTIKAGNFSLPGWKSPFPERLRLSRAVFQRADPLAIRALARRFGARYLVADKVHGQVTPLLAARVGLVYSSGDLDVYKIGKPPAPSSTCPVEGETGVTAVFGLRRTFASAEGLWRSVTGYGYRDAVIQQRGCHTFAVVLTGLASDRQGKQLQREAARVDLPVRLECKSHRSEGGLNAVFGHRRTRLAALKLAALVAASGFRGLEVRQDRCGDWEVDLHGLKTAAQRTDFRSEAGRAGFRVRFEPG
jgi:hypothetical protein